MVGHCMHSVGRNCDKNPCGQKVNRNKKGEKHTAPTGAFVGELTMPYTPV